MSFKGVCKKPSAKITIHLFLNFDTLKKATIQAYFGIFWQLQISMIPSMWNFCKFWVLSGYTQTHGIKGIPEISHPEMPITLHITQMFH